MKKALDRGVDKERECFDPTKYGGGGVIKTDMILIRG